MMMGDDEETWACQAAGAGAEVDEEVGHQACAVLGAEAEQHEDAFAMGVRTCIQ